MARISLDDDLDHDPRIMILKAIVGDVAAWGSLFGAYRVAARYYVPERKPIPMKIFKLLPWSQPLIESGVAELTEDGSGVFIILSEDQFGWLISKHENGKKGGRPKDEPNLTGAKPKETENKFGFEPETHNNPIVIVPAITPALSQIQKQIQEIQAVAKAPASQAEESLPEKIDIGAPAPKRSKFSDTTRQKMRAFIAAYAKGWEAKYKSRPEGIRDKALVGKLGHWIEHVAEVRAINLIEAYLQISYRPFDENYHDLWQFFRHLNRIGVALDTGKDANSIDWSKVFWSGDA